MWSGLRSVLVGADPPSPRIRSPRRVRTLRVLAGIVAVGAGLILFGSLAGSHATPVLVFFAVLVGAPVIVVLRRPLLAWRLAWSGLVLAAPFHLAVGNQPWPWHPLQLITLPLVLVAVGARHPFGVLVWVWGLTGALIVLLCAPGTVPGLVVALTVALALGDQIRRRGEAQRGLRVQAQLNEEEQQRRAVLEERARIARDMHDVVAHHMSLIAVRAESAPYRLAGQSTESAAEFAAIAEEARLSLAEMRRLLGVLRQGDAPQLAPQPGLDEVAQLVEAAQAAGVWVAMRREGELAGVGEAAGLTGYRIVQEALANAGRHAPGALVHVQLRGTAEDVLLTVVNGPATLPVAEPGAGAAHGLVGMRERVAVLGGTFHAGTTPDGGFQVKARLPRRAA